MYESAAWVLLESAIADLPADLRWLFESGAVTVEQLAALHHALGVTSAADLARRRRRSSRSAPSTGLERTDRAGDCRARCPISGGPFRAFRSAGRSCWPGRSSSGCARCPASCGPAPGGSLRRGQDTVGDIEIVAATTKPGGRHRRARSAAGRRALSPSQRPPRVPAVRARAGRRSSAGSGERRRGRCCSSPARPRHLAALRAHADSHRLAPDEGRPAGRRRHASPVRDGGGDLRRARPAVHSARDSRRRGRNRRRRRAATLPALLSKSDIRGDLHMHTEFSDGRDPVEAMVQVCRGLGYEYMAITDHSPHSAASRNLSVDSIARQADEIARLRELYPEIAILHGCEVDILPDGRLDFPDRVLERLDIVLASLHERAGTVGRPAAAALRRRDEASARHLDHASDQPARAAQARLRSRLRRALRDGGRDRHDRRDRRVAGAPRSRRRARAAGDCRRRHWWRWTATATARSCSMFRWSSASRPRGAAGSSAATSSTPGRSPRSARSSPPSAGG